MLLAAAAASIRREPRASDGFSTHALVA